MKKLIFVCCLFMIGCDDSLFDTEYTINLQLRPYVDEFYKEALNRNILIDKENLIVKFANMDCCDGKSIKRGNQRIVQIDRDEWEYRIDQGHDFIDSTTNLSLGIQEIIFHELGHALLYRNHISSKNYTIMTNDSKWSNDFYKNYNKRQLLIDELFDNCLHCIKILKIH